MCGITGFIDFNCYSNEKHLEQMRQALLHRGPDDQGMKLQRNGKAFVGSGDNFLETRKFMGRN